MKKLIKYPIGTRKTISDGIDEFFKLINDFYLSPPELRCVAHVYQLHLKKGESIEITQAMIQSHETHNFWVNVLVDNKKIIVYFFNIKEVNKNPKKKPKIVHKRIDWEKK